MKIKTTSKQIWLLLVSCLLMATAAGAFDGEFKSMGYNVHFFYYGSPMDGDNSKEATADTFEISVSTSNTFSASFSEVMLHRHIINQFTSEPEVRCINTYWAGVDTGTDTGTGTVAPAPNLVLNLSPADEDIEIPLYFSADTNIAIRVDGVSDGEADAESGLGISLLIRKGSGMDESALSGPYARYTMGNAVHGGGSVDRLVFVRSIVEFDGSGNYTENSMAWLADRATSEKTIALGGDNVVDSVCTLTVGEMPFPDSGTYSVAPDGTVVTHGLLGTVTNQLSPDGKVAASIHVVEGAADEAYLNVAVKLPKNMPTNAVDAVYFVTVLSEQYDGYEADGIYNNTVDAYRAWFYLEPDGTFSARGDFWKLENRLENVWGIYPPGSGNLVSGNIFSTEPGERIIQFAEGTYSIETNGIMTLSFDTADDVDDDEEQWQLSADGEFLVFGDAWWDANTAEREMGIGIRRDPPSPISAPVVFNNDMAMTPTGLVMTATMPANHPVEGISTDDLMEGRWHSGGIFSTETGTVDIHDPSATNDTVRFYSATFVPW